ncbi:hypothetical protein DTO166G4_8869 [Paecilomyces variotii]|nr:hypothetical protein DTO166G4_8869 [Paecilomyces variotii]KAJ9227930.1 hypothetical protein DTO166G5_9001 [Paecilomyces variotii]KAJ9254299.1 hypothetical protein DTO195F2_6664 [Paecilomyces variotii]KAJ9306601.1 hypothetical protein DTO217A2_3953 [Paecilomyces variotii]KAJ9311882.1 hypothetical protein DTO271D3_7876 [Paecilomyces variotii]
MSSIAGSRVQIQISSTQRGERERERLVEFNEPPRTRPRQKRKDQTSPVTSVSPPVHPFPHRFPHLSLPLAQVVL